MYSFPRYVSGSICISPDVTCLFAFQACSVRGAPAGLSKIKNLITFETTSTARRSVGEKHREKSPHPVGASLVHVRISFPQSSTRQGVILQTDATFTLPQTWSTEMSDPPGVPPQPHLLLQDTTGALGFPNKGAVSSMPPQKDPVDQPTRGSPFLAFLAQSGSWLGTYTFPRAPSTSSEGIWTL